MTSNKTIFIGIAGASASGKTLLAETIFQELQNELGTSALAIIKEDSYYNEQGHLSLEERASVNYDHPNAFDHELLIEHLDSLDQGKAVQVPIYDYALHNRSDQYFELQPVQVVLIEGILLLHDKAIRKRLDAKVFMDTPLDICLLRRLRRDVQERSRTVESVIEQYKRNVRPMFLEFIEPSKQFADIIVPRGGRNRVAIEMIMARILQMLAD